MNVLCVNADGWARLMVILGFKTWLRADGPKLGDEDMVVGEHELDGLVFYELKRWPGGKYDSNYFIPLNENDEVDSTREPVKEKETVSCWPLDKSIKM